MAARCRRLLIMYEFFQLTYPNHLKDNILILLIILTKTKGRLNHVNFISVVEEIDFDGNLFLYGCYFYPYA